MPEGRIGVNKMKFFSFLDRIMPERVVEAPFSGRIVKLVMAALLVSTAWVIPQPLSAQSEASGLFLLISPGARAGGMGEAQVAVANDAYASYWNPAGLAFLDGHELAAMHVNWLPGLASDMYYEFAAYRQRVPSLGTFGAHLTYLNLGEQVQTGLSGPEELSRFRSYMWSGAVSFGRMVGKSSAVGGNLKIYRQFLAPAGVSDELTKDGAATSVAVDLAYLTRHLFTDRLAFGAMLSNMGPSVSFMQGGQADPSPTSLRVGLDLTILDNGNHQIHLAYDASKLLTAYDNNGDAVPFYQAIFTSWTDESGSVEMKQILHNFGVEYWFQHMLALRIGGMYQAAGEIRTQKGYPIPTFGAGIRYQRYGFDFGYVAGDKDHPLTNTMRFSVNMEF